MPPASPQRQTPKADRAWLGPDDAQASARSRRLERRRRELHLRRLRRDLLEDFGIAIVLMILVLVITAGLGVVALLEIPVAGAVVASYVLERRRRVKRRARRADGRRS